MQVKKIFTYTIDELPMKVQNKVIANRIQELATNTTDVVLPELYEFLNHQYILLKEIIWNKSSGIRAFNCVIQFQPRNGSIGIWEGVGYENKENTSVRI